MQESINYKKLAKYAECRKNLLTEAVVYLSIAKKQSWEEGNVHEWGVLDFAAEFLQREAIQAGKDAVLFMNYNENRA